MRKKIFSFLSLGLIALLCSATTPSTPFKTAQAWLKEEELKVGHPHFKFGVLATVGKNAQPSTRIVELISVDKGAALFFSHKSTLKVQQIKTNPLVSITLWLPQTKRQLTLDGKAQELSNEESNSYWLQMPKKRQLNFLASDHQSELKKGELEKKLEQLEKTFPGDVPMPQEFIGYKIMTEHFVFYEIQTGNFAQKHVASLEDGIWTTKQMHP
jgi:pyridoxamine 5'-phosphate oxidase